MAQRYRRRRRQARPEETIGTLAVIGVLAVVAFALTGRSNPTLLPYLAGLVGAVLAAGVFFAAFRYHQLLAKRNALRLLTIAEVDRMSGLEFEAYTAELFRRQGYKIQLTPINDDGVDIVLQKDGIRTAVQVKRYTKPVAQAAIREAVAGMLRYKCSRSMVVTNSVFTRAAVELARSNSCTLVDRDRLAQLIVQNQLS